MRFIWINSLEDAPSFEKIFENSNFSGDSAEIQQHFPKTQLAKLAR